MLKRMPHTITAEQSLKSGLFKLRDIAACAYGNGKWIQYRDAAGTCKLTMSMGEIVKNASVEDVEVSKALAVLSTGTLPENGVKSMVILLVSLLEKAENLGCTEADVNAVYALLEYAAEYLPAIAKENNGVYERMKALAPNQFFSLNQVGIERSISVDSPYTDIWTMGFDPIDGTIKDCRDMAYRDKEEDVRNVLLAVKNALRVIWNIAASL